MRYSILIGLILNRYVVIVACVIAFILMSTFPGWHEESGGSGSDIEVKPFPSRQVLRGVLIVLVIGFGLGIISILWQHINSSSTASVAEILSYGAVSGHVGAGSMALGWISVAIIGLVGTAILTMILSISMLRKLTDDSE
jgi:hypothetical protein